MSTPTVLITGANRGLGLEFARQYAADGWSVVATARRPSEATTLRALVGEHDVRLRELDVADLRQIDALASELSGEAIDVLLLNAGTFGPAGDDADGQRFGSVDYEAWRGVLAVNALAPLRMAEAFREHVARSKQKKIVAVSSRMGSVALTTSGSYAYRTSKAALNMAVATAARDLAEDGIAVGIYSPGWVRTDMGGAGADLSSEESVAGLREQIAALTLQTSGHFRDHLGEAIPW
jgi:NAD(P)-dependent dehydrogenase (short-subunit alcohol dehydrogenase family)